MSSTAWLHFGIGGRIRRLFTGASFEHTLVTAAPKPDAAADTKAIAAVTLCKNPRRFMDLVYFERAAFPNRFLEGTPAKCFSEGRVTPVHIMRVPFEENALV